MDRFRWPAVRMVGCHELLEGWGSVLNFSLNTAFYRWSNFMKVVVNWPLCDGNGVCAIEAPEVFSLDDQDQLIVAEDQDIDPAALPKVEAAVRLCPKQALRLRKD